MPLPCANQTFDSVKEWVEQKPLTVNDEVIVRETYGGMTEYRLDTVLEIDHGQQRRVILQQHGSFYRSGKNCFHPKGQTHFIQPTPELRDAAVNKKCWLYGEPMDS